MKRSILLLLIALSLLSCGKSKFKRSTFLQELFDYKITPELSDFQSKFGEFDAAWDSYLSDQTPTNLDACKNKFNAAIKGMDQIQFYNMGEISQTYIYNKFNKGNIDTTEMWAFYSDHNVITSADISSLANNKKGMYAVEYLLYTPYADDSLGVTKYQSWISLYIEDIAGSISTLSTSWSVYEKNFTESTDDGVDGSFNIVSNRIINMIEDIVDKRLNPVLTSSDYTLGYGHYSENTIESIKNQFQTVNDVFIGVGTQEFNSVCNYLHKKNKKLAVEVKADFDDIITYQNGLTQTMEWYVANDIGLIENYKQKLIDLLVKFKLDVANAMGIIITFGDTDGD